MTNQPGQNTLIVPIQVNALNLEMDQTVMDAKADFSRLPWSNGQEDFNADTPFLGEAVLSPPFENKNFTMAAGLHLHWVLPRAHRTYPTTTDSSGNKKKPYPAPNRWLITKDGGEQWVVESDYLDTATSLYNKNAVTVPVFNDAKLDPLRPPASTVTPNPQPYRYLGRQVPMAHWPVNDSAKHWSDEHPGHELTAFGYGELAFNTFYPNCRSAFGFYDPKPGTSYTVIGWYHHGDNDIVQKAIDELTELIANPAAHTHLLRKMFDDDGSCPAWLSDLISGENGNAAWKGHSITTKNYKHLEALLVSDDATNPISLSGLLGIDTTCKDEFMRFGIGQILNWKFNGTTAGQTGYPTQSIYYSSVTISDSAADNYDFGTVAVGNSASEALSAYLDSVIGTDSDNTPAGTVENLLNAILHGSSFQGNLTDAQLNFEEVLHESGFDSKPGGSLWRIRKIQVTGENHKETENLGQETLPEPLADLLNQLNLAQTTFDEGLDELLNTQQQLYSTWSKYMGSAYPPLGTSHDRNSEDDVKAYAEWQVNKVMALKTKIGKFIPGSTPADSEASGVYGHALLSTYNAIYEYLNTPPPGQELSPNGSLEASEGRLYELSQVPAPRYYRPKDPVLVFVDDENNPPAQAGSLKSALNVAWDDSLATPSSGVPTLPTDLPSTVDFTSVQTKSTPQILEWMVDFFPIENGSNLTTGSGDYSTDFLGTNNFTLGADSFDFDINENVLDVAASYKGSTYTSTTAQANLQEKLMHFLLGQYPDTLSKTDFVENQALSKSWKDVSGQATTDYTDPGCTAYEAYNHLQNKYILSQSIGGFNQALLQFQHNVHLPIADPLGFKDYQTFVNLVAVALEGVRPPVSNPFNLFIPLRTGALHLDQLSLVDHFGISMSLDSPTPIISESLKMSKNPSWFWLGPRFTQEARLNFRWLAAVNESGDTNIEMNSHPATSLVCGWILPNYLDDSLVFYDHNGKGLGSFATGAKAGLEAGWNPFPGELNPIKATDITSVNPMGINTHLLKVMMAVLAGTDTINGSAAGAQFVDGLINKIQSAQQMIYPENHAGHDALSILMGKPIAIVRAMINLEVKGGTMSDQGWIPFGQEILGAAPQTDGYDQISVPINLGDPRQLNDGLIGYWEENSSGDLDNNVNVLTADLVASTKESARNTLQQTLTDDPVNLTMLMDPHGVVHATCGVLPVKVIDIPPDQYTKALKNIEVAFFSGALVTPENAIQLSVPKESGYQWSWLQQNSGSGGASSWLHMPDLPLINETLLSNAWAALEITTGSTKTIIQELTSQEWLSQNTVKGTNCYQVLPVDGRGTLSTNWIKYQTQIEQLIYKNLTGMTPYNTNAQFDGQQRLLDGWLLLSQDTVTNTSQS